MEDKYLAAEASVGKRAPKSVISTIDQFINFSHKLKAHKEVGKGM